MTIMGGWGRKMEKYEDVQTVVNGTTSESAQKKTKIKGRVRAVGFLHTQEDIHLQIRSAFPDGFGERIATDPRSHSGLPHSSWPVVRRTPSSGKGGKGNGHFPFHHSMT